ncbi:hypothetical protein ACJMK2_009708 [Sinanodonta woodiana]|uniref:Maestro heat-like repeat-containing protein family member 1 n=1 Tax=Sinanodonta woodiana TaxID=1069815 RepID=A0ABD3VD26_SINWO
MIVGYSAIFLSAQLSPASVAIEMTLALIDAAYDNNQECQDVICASLVDLGKKKPELVLSFCYSYLKKHSKLAQGHRVVILQCVERIVKETLDVIDLGLAVDLIKQASSELTQSKEVVPEWQTAASGVLVALGTRFCNEVMDEMLQKFQPGVMPHFFVVQTIGNLAAANVYKMVPHLTAVLGTMLPMLGMAKQENMKWVFSTALSKFCEAVIDYIANIDKAPDPTVKKEIFSSEILAAYDILFNVWLQSKEEKLRLAIVEAVGHITHLMARDKLEEHLPKMLQGILNLYKRHTHPLHITQGLCNVLDAACTEGSTILEPHLEGLLGSLFPQIFTPPDFNNPLNIKNHNEVLRCFAILAKSFSGKLTGALLQKLESSNEKIRIGVLIIFKHLINAASKEMEDKKEVVVSGLKMMTNETNNKVKKVFAQVIIAMGHHGYMELEGGQQMIEFIVSQCALQDDAAGKRSPDPEYISNQALRHMCENVLQLLTNTVEQMESVLWPFLLEMLMPEKYTDAIGVVCKCLATLATKKRKEKADDYEIDFETQANVPKPPVLIARLMVLAGRPQGGRGRGVHVLQLMQGLSPNLHEHLVELWDTVIPKLISYLEDPEKENENWSQKTWEDLLLKLLSKTLEVIDLEEWTSDLGETFASQISLYNNLPFEKNILFKCLGVTMRKSTKKDFVNKQLDTIFSAVKHTDQTEREGCAIAMGFSAASHLDAVLTKLESVTKNELMRKSSGLLSFMKDKSEGDVEKIKATVMLCYGYVAMFSPPTLIVSRMEATILRSLIPHFVNVKDTSVKTNLIRTVDLIGKALHPDHLEKQYNFSNRIEFINHLQSYMKAESMTAITSETRALAMNACATLVKLDPQLSDAEIFDLIKTSTDCVYGLPFEGIAGKKSGKGSTYEEHLEAEVLLESTFEALNDLLIQILSKECTPANLTVIFKHLVPWLLSVQDHERERALKTCQTLQVYLLENYNKEKHPQQFESQNLFIARLVPRCSDPSIEVRMLSMDCIQLTLQIASCCEGFPADHKDSMIEAVPTLKERLRKGDPNVMYSVVNDLSKVIAKKLPQGQVLSFIELLQEGLVDPQSHSSSGACVVLNGVMKNRGGEVIKQVDYILGSLHEKLSQIQFAQTKTGTLRTIRTMAAHHLQPVLMSLLSYSLPFDENTVEIWKILSQDAQLTSAMLDEMIELLHKSLPYEEKRDGGREEPVKFATPIPVAVTCALTEIFKVEETEEEVNKKYHRLFADLMLRIGSANGVKPLTKQQQKEKDEKNKGKKKPPPPSSDKAVKPSSVAVTAFRTFLERTKSEDIIEVLNTEGCWEKFEDEEAFPEAINILCRAAVNSSVSSQYVSRIVACLNSSLSSLYDNQRIVVTAFFAELVQQKCMGDAALVELVMNSLLGRLIDSSHIVRKLCIRGLGNVASVGTNQVQKYSTTVLSAMMAGMDDKEDPEDDITIEAMSGLSRILTEIDESHIRAILINVALRIRPCFEKEKTAVRSQAITLFGNLARFGDGPSKEPFLEQIHSNFISLLLHLNDPEEDVVKACKYSLRLLGPLLGSEAINNKFQRHLLDDAKLHYGEFMNDLSKLIIQDFPEKVNFYIMGCVAFFKSVWPEVKSNAALFAGYLLGNLPKERQTGISKEHVCAALIMLLKDQSSSVRSRTAEAISLLQEY